MPSAPYSISYLSVTYLKFWTLPAKKRQSSLRGPKQVEVASTREGSLSTTAVERILEVGIDRIGAMGVVFRAEGWITELHVSQHSGERNVMVKSIDFMLVKDGTGPLECET
jgi:hypothetical protein